MLADIEPIIDDLRDRVRHNVKDRSRSHQNQYYYQNYPLPFREYCRLTRDIKPLLREYRNLRPGDLLSGATDTWPLRRLLSFGDDPKFTPDFYGWVEYLKCLSEPFYDEIEGLSQNAFLPEELVEEHMMIVAPSKWGKSELIKTLVHHYVVHEQLGAVIVIDPHPDMTPQIARWRELVRSGRGIYIEPDLRPGRVVSLNLFDGRGLDINERRLIASFWASQISSLSSPLTTPMLRIALNCIHILLNFKGATMLDLMELLNTPKEINKRNARQRALLEVAKTYPDRTIRQFFENDFTSQSEESSRSAVKRRVEIILQLPHAAAMLCGSNCLDLEKAIEEHKIVLFNLSPFGAEGSKDIGRLLVALIGQIMRRRHKIPLNQRTRTHLFIDESSALISDELLRHLKELRKFGLFTRLSQQSPSDGLSKSQAAVLSDAIGTKFLGSRNGDKSGFLNTDDELPPLSRRQFYVDCETIDGIGLLHVRDDLAGSNNSVSDADWHKYEEVLVGKYYNEVSLDGEILPPEQDEYVEDAGVALTSQEGGTPKSTVPLNIAARHRQREPISMVPPPAPAAATVKPAHPQPPSVASTPAGQNPTKRPSRGRRGR